MTVENIAVAVADSTTQPGTATSPTSPSIAE